MNMDLFRIPDPGLKKAPDPGSRIRIRYTGSLKNLGLDTDPDLGSMNTAPQHYL